MATFSNEPPNLPADVRHAIPGDKAHEPGEPCKLSGLPHFQTVGLVYWQQITRNDKIFFILDMIR